MGEELAEFEGQVRTAGDLVKQASYLGHRTMGTQGALLDARRPPILPDDFEHQMQAKTLTNGKDRAVLVDLQRAVTTTVLRSVELLDFASLGWGDADAQQLSKALPWCCALTDLRLNANNIGPPGASAIAEALKVNAVLTSCDLEYNHIGVEGAKALASALEVNAVLTTLNLFRNEIGPSGAAAIAEALKVNR